MGHLPGKRSQRLEAVDSRGRKADRACVCVVLADRRHLADLESKRGGLDEHLRVEDEIVAVLEKWDCLEEASRICAVAGVVLGQVQPKHSVLGGGQEAIADPFPPWR